jgi:hypothetical protein
VRVVLVVEVVRQGLDKMVQTQYLVQSQQLVVVLVIQ